MGYKFITDFEISLQCKFAYWNNKNNPSFCNAIKVHVKVMMTSPPSFTNDRSYHVIKVQQGATAIIRCQATGDPAPTVTWFSPTRRVIPLSSSRNSERIVMGSDGTLELRQVQNIDAGNYTCRATNSAGDRSRVVGLEVEPPNLGPRFQMGGKDWSSFGTGRDHGSKAEESHRGYTAGVTGRFHGNTSSNNSYREDAGKIRTTMSINGINIGTDGHGPATRSDSRNGFNVGGITTQVGSVISIGVDGARNIGVKADSIGIHRHAPNIFSSGNSMRNSHSMISEGTVTRNSGSSSNEVTVAGTDTNAGRESSKTSGVSRNSFTNSNTNNGNSRIHSIGVSNSNQGANNSTNTVVGVLTTLKRRVIKGQTIVLPCPSLGSSPLTWLLPGNGVLPAPYYGSRLTVHRNGSLEVRGVRVSDSGTFVCVVRGERGETRIQVELEVSEPRVAPQLQFRGQESSALSTSVLSDKLRPGAIHAPSQSKPGLTQTVHQSTPVTQKPLQQGATLPAAPRPIVPPLSAKPVVSTQTAPLVSIINGETLRLPCTAPQASRHTQGSLSWTLPSSKVMSRGESVESGRYSVLADGTLVVHQASVFDRGTYVCRSTSSDSSSVTAITVPVIVIAYPPRITTGPSPVTYTRPGVAVELPCLTIATPRATITWETPDLTQLRVMGQARVYGNRYLSPHGSLVIQNPTSRDTGFYRCTAKNVIGMDTKATYLHVM